MFGDRAQTALLSRPDTAVTDTPDLDGENPTGNESTYHDITYGTGASPLRPAQNPLVRGLVVLVLLALTATVLLVTDGDDADDQTLAAGNSESGREAAAGPVATAEEIERATTTVFGPATSSQLAPPASGEATGDGLEIDPEAIRLFALPQLTTTEAPTTTASTAAPATAAPTTAAPSSTAPPDTEAPTTTVAPGDDPATTEGPITDPETDPEVAPDPDPEPEPETTLPPETTVPPANNGWVDTGNGVLVPPVLLDIRWCESGGRYDAANPSSSARGAYQFLTGSWAAYGHAARYGVNQAHKASAAQQDEAALITWERDGTRPWNASKHCWSNR